MAHFIDSYADKVNDMLHIVFGGARFFKQEIIEVPDLLSGLLITWDGIRDDAREVNNKLSWEEFTERMALIKKDWKTFDRSVMEKFVEHPEKCMMGYEGRTIYFMRGGNAPEYWTVDHAKQDTTLLVMGGSGMHGPLIYDEVVNLRERIPVGKANFREYEHQVRVVFNYLFLGELGEGQAQSRTNAENEGLEIRDIVFANKSTIGFWKDLKEKYSVSEVVVDTKNTDDLTRDDLRQLYCYLKEALGYWGFIVCRSQPTETMQAFNRTLYKNFSQKRGVLVLCDDDLRRMIEIKLRGNNPSEYLQEKMSEFTRSI